MQRPHFTGKAEEAQPWAWPRPHGGSEASWGLGTGPHSLSLGCLLLSVQVDDAGDEAVAVRGARPHLELGGGQFPLVHRPDHQAFPSPGLLQPGQGGLQHLFVTQVGWVGPGGQTQQPTWGGVGKEQVSGGGAGARDRKVVPFLLTSSREEVLPALSPGQPFPSPSPWCSLIPPPGIPSASSAYQPPTHLSRPECPLCWEFGAESP